MSIQTLDPDLAMAVLKRLQVCVERPDRRQLDKLINAYVRVVPWESAVRIVKRAQTNELEACPRWPGEFWQDHLQRGGGGTCFESNYAFFSLLLTLGYEGYLTINNMGDSIGCHTAIIILIDGQKWLVDAGFPLYAALPFSPEGVSQRGSPFYHYTIRPEGADRYQIERQPHPNWNAFTLIDRAVSEEAYRRATIEDYGADGYFLDRVIVHKILDELPWRFTSGEEPAQFTYFKDGKRYDQVIQGDLVTAVSRKFSLDQETVRRALEVISES